MTGEAPFAASVIIPLYQDADTIGAVLESLARWCPRPGRAG